MSVLEVMMVSVWGRGGGEVSKFLKQISTVLCVFLFFKLAVASHLLIYEKIIKPAVLTLSQF